jgi:hypothetical protein
MFAPEDGYVCARLLSRKPRSLRRVFIEVSIYFPNVLDANKNSARVTGWHDWPRTLFACREHWPDLEKPKTTTPIRLARYWLGEGGVEPLLNAWPKIAPHLQYFVTRLFNMGTGAAGLGEAIASARSDDLDDGSNGFVSPDFDTSPEALALYAKELARMRSTPVQLQPLPALAQENLNGILKLVRAAGAEPVLFICPTTSPLKFFPKNPDVRLLDFCDEKRWPELFQIDHRLDTGHMNTAGSEIFTRELAEEWIRQTGGRP